MICSCFIAPIWFWNGIASSGGCKGRGKADSTYWILDVNLHLNILPEQKYSKFQLSISTTKFNPRNNQFSIITKKSALHTILISRHNCLVQILEQRAKSCLWKKTVLSCAERIDRNIGEWWWQACKAANNGNWSFEPTSLQVPSQQPAKVPNPWLKIFQHTI